MNKYEKRRKLSLNDDGSDITLLEHQSIPPRRRLSSLQWMSHGVLVVSNLIFLLINVSWTRIPAAPYSPAQDAISYETKTYNYSIFSKNEFNGEPGPAQQAAWSELMSHESILLSADELQRLNRTSIEVPGEGYLSELSVFHQLHCLDYVRQYVYSDYYGVDEDAVTVRLHISHCIDTIRQAIECFGDTSLVTYSWRPDYRRPWPDFQITKQCRSFNALKAWSAARRPSYQNGDALNPHFDESFDGRTPTGKEGATELVQGTRLNPKILKDLGQL